ncbi:MAG: hypothetical protein QOE61_1478, partial [Micromonosporaceae bacterium]|nr:hypothetical protein [Micromonosporaceae bacterium]
MDVAALAEASYVLDRVTAAADDGTPDVAVINDVALLHRLRAMGSGESFEERHACGAMQVLAYAIDPAAVAPDVREEAATAIAQGAPTDLRAALLRGLQGNASAVRAA